MTSVYEAMIPFNRRLVRYDGRVGVEVETESLKTYDPPKMKFWQTTVDNSLRNFGIEYILTQPVNLGKELDTALLEFQEKTANIKFIKDAISTSVHVHLNFLNSTFLHVANFLTLYALFENVLIRYSGEDRLSNLFCLPMQDAERIVEHITELLQTIGNSKGGFNGIRLDQNQMKYGAINLASFASRGSLEIRSFRGETDISIIKKWVSLLTSMQSYAENVESPNHVIETWKNSGIEMIEQVFGEHYRELLYDDVLDLIEGNRQKEKKSNLFYAVRIAGAIKDWSKFGDFSKPKKTEKQILQLRNNRALGHFGTEYAQLRPVDRIFIDEMIEREGYDLGVVARNDEPQEDQPNNNEIFNVRVDRNAWAQMQWAQPLAGEPLPLPEEDNLDDDDFIDEEQEEEDF